MYVSHGDGGGEESIARRRPDAEMIQHGVTRLLKDT